MISFRTVLACLIGLKSIPFIAAKGGCTGSMQQKGFINGATYDAEPELNVNSMAECVDKCTMDSVCEGVLWASKEIHGLPITSGPMVNLLAKSCLFMTTAPQKGTVVPTVSFDNGTTTYSFHSIYYCIMDYTSQCSPNVCKNGAMCLEDVNGGVIPECICSQAGPWYSGQICQTIDNTSPILYYTLRKSNIDVTLDSGKVFPLGSFRDTWSCAFACYKSQICMGILFKDSTGDCVGLRSKPAKLEIVAGPYNYYDRSNSEGSVARPPWLSYGSACILGYNGAQFTNFNLLQCKDKCEAQPGCLAIEYYEKSAGGFCVLGSSGADSSNSAFQRPCSVPGWTYHEYDRPAGR